MAHDPETLIRLSHGVAAGNYGFAYDSEDPHVAWEMLIESGDHADDLDTNEKKAQFRAGFVLGFALHEHDPFDDGIDEEIAAAREKYGALLKDAGVALDDDEDDE